MVVAHLKYLEKSADDALVSPSEQWERIEVWARVRPSRRGCGR